MALHDPDTARILAFLDRIGIAVARRPVAKDSFLPGIEVRGGGLVVDPPFFPGDLLHEAGHIAVTDPALRPALDTIAHDPAEEMAAIAWSWAAARAIGLDPRVIFHSEGYRGGGEALVAAFEGGAQPGVPMLQYYRMAAEPHQAEALGLPAYPAMARWLR